MKIYTFSTGSEDLAPGLRAIARIRHPPMPIPGKPGKVAADWHPVIFHAATEEAAYEAAQAWWDAELAKERAKAANAATRAEKMRKKPKGVQTADTPEPAPEDDDPGPIL